MKSTIIVTGAAGFIGSHPCDCVLVAGHGVLTVDDLSSGRLANLAEARERPNFVFEPSGLRLPRRFAEAARSLADSCAVLAHGAPSAVSP